jgi:hypothetical protein
VRATAIVLLEQAPSTFPLNGLTNYVCGGRLAQAMRRVKWQ